MKVLETNILANHPSYPKIIEQYNLMLKENGKVNAKKFYEEVILLEIPEYNINSWYKFLRRLKTAYGIAPIEIAKSPTEAGSTELAEEGVARALLSNDEATRKLVQTILNVSAEAAAEVLEDPNNIDTNTLKRIELGLKTMKAQDSRIHAIGKIREDKREQDKFERAFSDAAYGG